MSAEAREKLATAISSVEGVNVSPWFRQTTKAGDGMVRLDRIDYPNKFGGVATWQVLVVLPADIAAAEKYLEEIGPQMVEALSSEAVVTTFQPQQLAIDSGTVPVVVITAVRED